MTSLSVNPPVDLRSDTLTRPSPAMREVMARAEVGDDVYGEDPTVNALQERAAELTGMEAGLFVPSGTMANHIATLAHCRRGDEVIVGWGAHSYLYESGGGAALAGVQLQVVGHGGYFSVPELERAFHGYDPSGHSAPTTLVMLENTHNRGGGKWISPEDTAAVAEFAHAHGAAVHIDGARLWNAAAAAERAPSAWGQHVDSVTFCLSKGLGAPVGSVLCGSRAWIQRAHRFRKMLGGGMRQAGILAAAGMYALTDPLPQLREDHRKARLLAETLAACPQVEIDLNTVHTNIVLFTPRGATPAEVCAALDSQVRLSVFGGTQLRAVLHRDVSEADLARALEALRVYFSDHAVISERDT